MTSLAYPEVVAIEEFISADLTGAHFIDATLTESLFHAVDLSATHFENVSLEGGVFLNVDCHGLLIEECRIDGMRIDGVLVTDLLLAYRAQNPLTVRQVTGTACLIA